jgi:hypothetical protein
MGAALLIPILAEIGVPILKNLIQRNVKSDSGKVVLDTVVETVAKKIGVEATPEAIAKEYAERPEHTTAGIKEVEIEQADSFLEFLSPATAARDAMLARDDTKSFFAWGWRPAMSWLVIFLFGWAMVLLPLINAAFKSTIPAPRTEDILQLAGIWLVIYGGGHTLKSVFNK